MNYTLPIYVNAVSNECPSCFDTLRPDSEHRCSHSAMLGFYLLMRKSGIDGPLKYTCMACKTLVIENGISEDRRREHLEVCIGNIQKP